MNKFLYFFCCTVISINALADTTSLVEDANKLCGEIAREGVTEEVNLKGGAKAELDNIIKKLGLDIGISGQGEATFKKFSGVFQKDLADAINNGNNCKLEALKMLKEYSLEMEKLKSKEDPTVKIKTQLKNCINGSIIDCQGMNLKFQEANLRCKNNIRGTDQTSLAHQHNKCASRVGSYYQIQALVNQIYQNCSNLSSKECKKSLSDAKYHDEKTLDELSEFLVSHT